jgi:hypothetical protein
MRSMARIVSRFAWVMLAAAGPLAYAQDRNVALPVDQLETMLTREPMQIVSAEISRPKAKGDITLKAEARFGDHAPLRVKLRKAEPGAETFNNVPRYDLAAYELQKLFMDPAEYVVPPTALRMMPLDELRRFAQVERTFRGAEQALVVVQYWLNDVAVYADVYYPERFTSDPVYARHIGQLNVLTYLIEHRDSNAGNFLISRAEAGARVFSIDHGVAFASADSDRGMLWKDMRVKQLPADLVTRLRAITRETLEARLAVLAQWKLQEGQFVPVDAGPNLSPHRGVRQEDGMLQMGLRRTEIGAIWKLLQKLLARVDSGEITALEST